MAQTVTPYLLYADAAAAAAFLARAYGFREVDRQTGEAGGLHVELETGRGGRIYVGQPLEAFRNPAEVGRTCLTYVLVDDLDAHCERARREGAEIVEEPNDTPYGDRRYGARDPQGHGWFFATELAP